MSPPGCPLPPPDIESRQAGQRCQFRNQLLFRNQSVPDIYLRKVDQARERSEICHPSPADIQLHHIRETREGGQVSDPCAQACASHLKHPEPSGGGQGSGGGDLDVEGLFGIKGLYIIVIGNCHLV